MNILDACRDPAVFGQAFRDQDTWNAWFAFFAALFGLPMSADQRRIYRKCTNRSEAPTEQAEGGVARVWAARRQILHACAYRRVPRRLQRLEAIPGHCERGTITVIAADRRQARTIMRYCKGLFRLVSMLARTIEAERVESIDLTNRITIEVHTCSFRTIRGYSILAALCDETAFWLGEDSSNPDAEVISAIRPAMATIPDALLLCASSPYARRGVLWESYHRYFGRAGRVLVWNAPTRTMNPTVPQSFIDAEYEKDPISAAAEYGAEFRTDIESYISREACEACVEWGAFERGPLAGKRYVGFVDVSGGGADSFALAVAHKEDPAAVLDATREVRPPLSPEATIAEFVDLLKTYGITSVTGDHYGGEFPREIFGNNGIKYEPSKDPKGALYLGLLPLINSGKVRLLVDRKLIAQLVNLERRTARGGKESIDHPPGAHDDVANAVAGALLLAQARRPRMRMGTIDFAKTGKVSWHDDEPRTHSRIRWITVDKDGTR